jgi:hypothetical protein
MASNVCMEQRGRMRTRLNDSSTHAGTGCLLVLSPHTNKAESHYRQIVWSKHFRAKKHRCARRRALWRSIGSERSSSSGGTSQTLAFVRHSKNKEHGCWPAVNCTASWSVLTCRRQLCGGPSTLVKSLTLLLSTSCFVSTPVHFETRNPCKRVRDKLFLGLTLSMRCTCSQTFTLSNLNHWIPPQPTRHRSIFHKRLLIMLPRLLVRVLELKKEEIRKKNIVYWRTFAGQRLCLRHPSRTRLRSWMLARWCHRCDRSAHLNVKFPFSPPADTYVQSRGESARIHRMLTLMRVSIPVSHFLMHTPWSRQIRIRLCWVVLFVVCAWNIQTTRWWSLCVSNSRRPMIF